MRAWSLFALVALILLALILLAWVRCDPELPALPGAATAPSEPPQPAAPAAAAAMSSPPQGLDATALDRAAPQRVAVDHALRVRAVDRARQPVVGATIWCETERRAADGSITSGTQPLPPTAGDGTTQLGDARQQFAADAVLAVVLVARVVGADGPPVRLDPRALPDGLVDVEVPAHGRVVAELRGRRGEVWDDLLAGESFELATLDAGGQPENRVFLARVERARLEFARVAVGRRYRLSASSDWVAPLDFTGPVLDGATVVVAISLPPKLRLVAGRLRGPDGRPWPRPAQVRLEAAGRRSSGDLRLEPDGSFSTSVPGFLGPRPRFVFFATVAEGTLEALFEPDSDVSEGFRRLGDFTLQRPPVLVAGRLVWAAGPAVGNTFPDVQLSLEHCAGDGDGPWLGVGGPFPAAADGVFEQRGHPLAGRYQLVVHGAVAPREPIGFDPGSANLRVPVAAPSRLVATFRVDAGAAGDGWRIELVPLPGTPSRRPLAGPLQPGGPGARPGAFGVGDAGCRRDGDQLVAEFEGLAAGAYRLQAARVGAAPALTLLVDVAAGVAVDEARLRGLDLRGR